MCAGVLALSIVASASGVAAGEAARNSKPEAGRKSDRPIDAGTKREVPDYDGRGGEPAPAGEALLWVPRVVFAPLYVVSEYVVRRPVGWVTSKAEQERIPRKLEYVFTFGRPERDIGLIPTGLIDFGLRASVGAYFFWDGFVVEENALRVRAATGGVDWFLFSLTDRVEWRHHEVAWRSEYEERPDHVFHGFGPASSSGESWYHAKRAETGLRYTGALWRSSSLRTWVAVRHVAFDATRSSGGDPTLSQAIATGRFSTPPALSDGYDVALSGVEATLDSRARLPEELPEASDWVAPPGNGGRLQLRAEEGTDLRAPHRSAAGVRARYHWLKYGATLGGFLEMPSEQRVIGISAIADFVHPLTADGEIPFTEQVSLGGRRPLRGFLEGRLVDRSSLVALMEYRWPVWIWVDGVVHYAVGNVFGAELDGFFLPLLRQSFGLGIRATSSRDHAFEALIAFGTRTFDDGAGIENVRFTLGATSGF